MLCRSYGAHVSVVSVSAGTCFTFTYYRRCSRYGNSWERRAWAIGSTDRTFPDFPQVLVFSWLALLCWEGAQ